jgi:hypothetical protein
MEHVRTRGGWTWRRRGRWIGRSCWVLGNRPMEIHSIHIIANMAIQKNTIILFVSMCHSKFYRIKTMPSSSYFPSPSPSASGAHTSDSFFPSFFPGRVEGREYWGAGAPVARRRRRKQPNVFPSLAHSKKVPARTAGARAWPWWQRR